MSTSSPEELDSHALGDAFRRHKVLILACVLLVAALSYGYTRTLTESFTASTSVLVKPTLGNPFSPETGSSGQQVTIAMTTEAAVVDSDGVAALANKKLDRHWVPGSGTVTASVPPNTQVVRIVYEAPTAKEAQVGAQTVAQAFLDYRKAQTASSQKVRLATLQKQAAAVRKNLDEASEEAAKDDPEPNAVQNVQLYANQLVTLETTISNIQAAGSDPGTLVAPAVVPDGPSGLDPRLIIGGGVLVGLALGLTLAFWRERTDKRIRAQSELVVAGLPMLASLTSTGPRTSHRGQEHQRGHERLRTAVVASVPPQSTIALSAISSELPCADVTIGLGEALSQSGYRVGVVLVSGEGDRDHSGVHRRASVGEIAASTDVHDLLVRRGPLWVLPVDGTESELDEFVASTSFTSAVRGLRERFDYLLVAGPAASTASGVGAGRATDGLVVVVRDRSTTSEQVAELVVRARQLDVPVLGLVSLHRRSRLLVSAGRGPESGKAPDVEESTEGRDRDEVDAPDQEPNTKPDVPTKVTLPQ